MSEPCGMAGLMSSPRAGVPRTSAKYMSSLAATGSALAVGCGTRVLKFMLTCSERSIRYASEKAGSHDELVFVASSAEWGGDDTYFRTSSINRPVAPPTSQSTPPRTNGQL